MNEKHKSGNAAPSAAHAAKPIYSKRFYALVFALVALIVAALSQVGCRTVKKAVAAAIEWAEKNPEEAQAVYDKAKDVLRDKVTSEGKDPDAVAANDAADYALFQWKFGGFNGAGAVFDNRVQIKNLVIHANKMTYEWETAAGFTPWGAANVDDASKALVCAFVKNNAGQWVGGKFDWCSTNRTSRDFNHLGTKGEGTGYNGWTLADIPNPTEMAVVFVGWDNGGTGWRSNVLTGTWKR